jgi:ribonuclease HII
MFRNLITCWRQKNCESKPPIFDVADFSAPLICGVDEAGRGPLAGPVVAAAVILCSGFEIDGLDDSKRLTPGRREFQRERLIASHCLWGIGVVDHETIDEINILQATFLAMRRAIHSLGIQPDTVLVDGNHAIPELGLRQKAIINGDHLEPCISAASILAKTHRDEIMRLQAERFPAYGFEKHKGYATAEHLTRLFQHGPCPIHRKSFHPVATLFHRPRL